MRTFLLITALALCTTQLTFSQEEDGVLSLAIPVRSSLKFNRYLTSPTFSFVREQNTYINITNKRQWMQFDDAPVTYLANYTGRYSEDIGLGVGLFQQNYGVLTNFGGVLNFAYNAQLQRDSNLTFGLNVGFYTSSINEGSVVVNEPDPSLDNISKNSILTVSPGINYGLVFFDFGVSVNNLVQYNLNTSEILKEDPQQSIQAHIMYTGYMSSRGFFDESKFSALIRSEFKTDQTIFSGIAMITVPKGIWAQLGYNTVYGATGGIGMNVTKQIAIEYNYEKAIGDLATFGSSHELTVAYKFNTRNRYQYSGDDREEAFLIKEQKRKSKPKSATASTPPRDAETRAQAAEQKALELEETRIAIEERAIEREAAKEAARIEREAKAMALAAAKEATANQNQLAEETGLAEKAQADEEARLAAEAAQAEAARLAQAEAAAAEQQRLAAKQAQADEEARLAAEAAQAEAARLAQAEAAAAEQQRLAAEAAQAEAARLVHAQAAEQQRLAAEQAQADEEARLAAEAAQAEAARLAQAQAAEQQRLAAAQVQAEEEARLAAEAQTLAEEETRLEAEALADVQADLKITHKDELAKSMFALTESTKETEKEQEILLVRLNEVVITKNKDLKDLKEENDLSEQGIFMEPKPFKSISAENRAMEAIKSDLDIVINKRQETIKQLENLYIQRIQKGSNKNDETSQYYLKTIRNLKNEQAESERIRAGLVSTLESIKIATEIERKRRIKRALYDNEKDRFNKDMTSLERIKRNTPLSSVPLTSEDFDFGEEQSSNVQILKGVQNVENGYYMIIAVHENVDKRDAFLEKVVSAGQSNINFFYDVNTSKYYIYYQKFDDVGDAMNTLDTKEDKPYNQKMSVVKIEN